MPSFAEKYKLKGAMMSDLSTLQDLRHFLIYTMLFREFQF